MLFLNEINSTSTFIKELSKECDLPHGFSVRTDFQTNGHGQMSNKWESEKGKNILLSIMLRPSNIQLSQQFVLSQIVSLAIVETFEKIAGEAIEIKWPNDIYLRGKKLCGILIENTILGNSWNNSIVGIGLNINQTDFFSEAPNPISIKNITGENYDVDALANELVHNIVEYVDAYNDNINADLKSIYISKLYRLNGYHTYKDTATNETFEARILDIGAMGHISLGVRENGSENDTTRSYAFKEIMFL